MAKSDTEQKPTVAKHKKVQLLTAKRYADKKDLISALLADDGEYTIEEVEALIKNYLTKGTVI